MGGRWSGEVPLVLVTRRELLASGKHCTPGSDIPKDGDTAALLLTQLPRSEILQQPGTPPPKCVEDVNEKELILLPL